jgi:hypothetical protein
MDTDFSVCIRVHPWFYPVTSLGKLPIGHFSAKLGDGLSSSAVEGVTFDRAFFCHSLFISVAYLLLCKIGV